MLIISKSIDIQSTTAFDNYAFFKYHIKIGRRKQTNMYFIIIIEHIYVKWKT